MSSQIDPTQESQTSSTDPQPKPSRRTVVKVMATSACGAALGAGTTALVGKLAGRTAAPRWRFFSDAEAVLVDAICEQIIPADQDPGAREAQVVNFIDKQLVGPYTRYQQAYRTGLQSVQATSQEMFGRNFETLSFDDQTAVLKALESGKAAKNHWPDQTSNAFFAMMIGHTMQGFYGSPRHGGNKDYASYKMLGLSYPLVIGQNRY